MAENRLTKKWLKHHFSYCWWMYVVVIAISILGVNVVFTTTAYRAPEDKKIEIFILNDFVTQMTLQEEISARFFKDCPDQEELTVTNINLNGNDAYAYMQFSTYVAAQQGDVCLMPESEVLKLAASGVDGVFTELSGYIENGIIDTKDIDLSVGKFKTLDGTEGIYAIPADSLYGLLAHGNDPADSYLVLFAFGGNDTNAAMTANMMIDMYHSEKPEGYDELHRAKMNSATIF